MHKITFTKVTFAHKKIIFSWLAEPHVQEFWDSTQAHKDDIINFIEGRIQPSSYADGKYVYWRAKIDEEPFAMLMIIKETHQGDIDKIKIENLSKTGNTYGIDYMIGNPQYFGKGYGARTLSEFIDFIRTNVDYKADKFLIDPEANNPRAKHVYMKAGFEYIADFIMEGDCSGSGKQHHLLTKTFKPSNDA